MPKLMEYINFDNSLNKEDLPSSDKICFCSIIYMEKNRNDRFEEMRDTVCRFFKHQYENYYYFENIINANFEAILKNIIIEIYDDEFSLSEIDEIIKNGNFDDKTTAQDIIDNVRDYNMDKLRKINPSIMLYKTSLNGKNETMLLNMEIIEENRLKILEQLKNHVKNCFEDFYIEYGEDETIEEIENSFLTIINNELYFKHSLFESVRLNGYVLSMVTN